MNNIEWLKEQYPFLEQVADSAAVKLFDQAQADCTRFRLAMHVAVSIPFLLLASFLLDLADIDLLRDSLGLAALIPTLIISGLTSTWIEKFVIRKRLQSLIQSKLKAR